MSNRTILILHKYILKVNVFIDKHNTVYITCTYTRLLHIWEEDSDVMDVLSQLYSERGGGERERQRQRETERMRKISEREREREVQVVPFRINLQTPTHALANVLNIVNL